MESLEFEDGEKSKASVCLECGALKSGQGTMVITADYIDFSPLTANPTIAEGRQWFRSDFDAMYWSPDGTTIEGIQTTVWAEKIEGSLAGIKGFVGSVEGAEGVSWNFTMNPSTGVWIKQYSTDACFNCQMVYHGAYQHWTGNNTFVDVPNKADNVYGAGEVAVAHQTPDGTSVGTIPNPTASVKDIAWDGEYLWFAGNGNCMVYKVTTGGTVKDYWYINQPNLSANAVTWDGQYIWFGSGLNGAHVYQMTRDGATQVNYFGYPGGSNVVSLSWDGEYLWSVNTSNALVYKITPTGTVADWFDPAVGGGLFGVEWDGQYLWLSNAGSNWVYQFRTDGTNLGRFQAPTGDIIGSAWDGTYLWGGGSTAYTYQLTNAGNFDLDYKIAPT